jgi:hypothetical protein
LISFWIDYGLTTIGGQAAWRIPLCIQIIFALILGVGIIFFPYSPRWLMSKGRDEEALGVISKLRRLPHDHPLVVEEWRDIKATVEFDRHLERQRYPEHVDNGSKGRLIFVLLVLSCSSNNSLV